MDHKLLRSVPPYRATCNICCVPGGCQTSYWETSNKSDFFDAFEGYICVLDKSIIAIVADPMSEHNVRHLCKCQKYVMYMYVCCELV